MATFRLCGRAELTADAVTRRLGVRPTRAIEVGEPISRRSARTRDSSVWLLRSSSRIETGVELATQLNRLLVVLEPVTPLLWELVETGYQANWFCFIASHAMEHAAELDRPLLHRLLELPGDLWLDVCGDGTDGEGARSGRLTWWVRPNRPGRPAGPCGAALMHRKGPQAGCLRECRYVAPAGQWHRRMASGVFLHPAPRSAHLFVSAIHGDIQSDGRSRTRAEGSWPGHATSRGSSGVIISARGRGDFYE
jgi:hypothetical protein